MIAFRLLAALLALAGLIWFGLLYSEGSYPHVQAQVVEAAVTQTPKGEHQASFLLEYEYAGKKHEARLDTAFKTSVLDLAQREVDELPVGSLVSLPVHPEHPEVLNWPAFGKGGRALGPAILVVAGLLFWAIPEGLLWLLDRKTPLGTMVFGVFGSLGLFLMLAALACLSAPYKVWRDWPVATARIEHAEIVGAGRTRGLRLQCSFEVGGQGVLGVLIPPWRVGPQQAQGWLDQYPPGRELTLRYYPKDPRICRFDLGFSSFILSLGLALAGLMLTGLGWLIRRFA